MELILPSRDWCSAAVWKVRVGRAQCTPMGLSSGRPRTGVLLETGELRLSLGQYYNSFYLKELFIIVVAVIIISLPL